MIGVHTAASIKAAEKEYFAAHPNANLMYIAAQAVADRANSITKEGVVLVVAGGGNNGGDGLHAAARISAGGRPVLVWLAHGKGIPSGIIAARQAGVRFIDGLDAMRIVSDVSLVIDAVYGIGGRPELPEDVALFAQACFDIGVPVLSVDIPSGLSPDKPTVNKMCFKANWTTTFAAPKLCHVAQPAADFCGKIEVIDMGLDLGETQIHKCEAVDVARWWPWPGNRDDKYSRGVLGIDTGSDRYIGAAILSTLGAVYSGAGMIRFVGPDKAAVHLLDRVPSITIGAGEVQAWLVGCGWGKHDAKRMEAVLKSGKPTVMDAEALEHLPARLPEGWLLTPHAGELARMLGIERSEVVADPISCARQAAERWNTTVLLKGSSQYIAEPNGNVTIAIGGPAWSAQAGSGDVLSGVCGTLLASGVPAWQAGVLAASLQAMTADLKRGPYPPDEIAKRMPSVLAKIDTSRPQPIGEGSDRIIHQLTMRPKDDDPEA